MPTSRARWSSDRLREYDARWLFGQEINLMGWQALGIGSARCSGELGVNRDIVVGQDFSAPIPPRSNTRWTSGLMAAGCRVRDIGLCITPMALFRAIRPRRAGGGEWSPPRITTMAGPA